MKKLTVFFFSIANLFYGQTTVVDWSTLKSGCVGTANTSNTPNAVVTITGTNLTAVGRPASATNPTGSCSTSSPYYLTGTGSTNWNMAGLGLAVDWANATSNVIIDVVFTEPVCADLSFILHDLNGDSGSFPFEDKITVVGYDQNSTLIPITAANYVWSTCSGGDCSGANMAIGGAGGAGQSNIRVGRGTNGCFGTNVYGCSSNRVTFTLKSPTAPNKIKRVTITYSCAKNAPDVNAYFTGTNPAFQNIVISNVTAKLPPTVSLSTLCSGSGTSPVVQAVVTGTAGAPTYLWTGGTGISSSTALTTSVNAAPSTNTTYTFTATNGAPSAGCTQTAAIQVTAVNCSLLPIELISFNAIRKTNTVKLNWQTASEKNNDYFTVERSFDGINFEEIKKVKGAGNSYEVKNYNTNDESPSNELSYYRLKQTDFNGQFKYSNIVSIDADISKAMVSHIAPNPTTSGINFDFYSPVKGELVYEVADLTGRVIISKSEMMEVGNAKVSAALDEIPDGIYFLKVSFEKTNFVSINKIFKN